MTWSAAARLALVAGLLVSAPTFAQDGETVYKKAVRSVLTLEVETRDGKQSGGTAFLALRKGVAVTAWHVVEDAKVIVARFSDGTETHAVRILDQDEEKDLALIELAEAGSRPILPISTADPPVGSRVYLLGAPHGLEFSFTEGTVNQIRRLGQTKLIQYSAATNPGNSGGPLLDAKGHAVGVCLAVLRQSQNVNFAVKAWYATQLRPNAPSVSRVLESGLSESSSAPRRIAATSVLSGHQKAVSAASWSPDGSAVLTASEDETARIWNVKSKREEARLSGHTDYLTAASFRPVAAQHLQPLPRSTREIERLGLSLYPGTRLSEGQGAIASRDSSNGRVLTVKMYAPADYNLVSTHYSSRVYGATTRGSGDVQRITGRTCTLSDVEIMISPAANRAESLVMMWITIPPPLPLATQSYIVTASGDWTARLWNLKTRVQIATLRGHSKSITAAGFSSDGRRIVTSSQDGTSRIWDAATGDQLAKLDSQGYPLLSAMFAPDGIRIVTASMDKTARVYDAAACNEVTRLVGHRLAVAHAIFSPDGSRIATASWDKSARIWDAGSGRELVRFDGHSLPVSSVAFSPDGTRIATASWDKTARVWDARRGRELARLEGHDNLVLSVAFSPDGRRVLTASSDKTARIWDISVLD